MKSEIVGTIPKNYPYIRKGCGMWYPSLSILVFTTFPKTIQVMVFLLNWTGIGTSNKYSSSTTGDDLGYQRITRWYNKS